MFRLTSFLSFPHPQDNTAHGGVANAVLKAVIGGNDTAPVLSSLSLPPLRILGQSYFLVRERATTYKQRPFLRCKITLILSRLKR